MSELLDTIRKEIAEACRRHELPPPIIEAIQKSVDEGVCREHGGSEPYVPTKLKPSDDQVLAYLARHDEQATLDHFGMSRTTLWRVIMRSKVSRETNQAEEATDASNN